MGKLTAYQKFLQAALKHGFSFLGMNVDFTIIRPDIIRISSASAIAIFHIDPAKYPYGVKITDLEITTVVNATYTLNFSEYKSNDPNAPTYLNIIESIALSAKGHKKVSGADINDPDIAAGNYIYVNLPSTNIPWVAGKIIFYAKTE